jgi:hypothetical protein
MIVHGFESYMILFKDHLDILVYVEFVSRYKEWSIRRQRLLFS